MHGPPMGHTVPHAPQLRLFVSRLTHVLPQSVCPAAVLQPGTQAPPEHISSGAQALPHPPQLRGSICVSEQASPQSVVFAPQVHWLFWQLAPAGQGVLHAPQLFGSLVRSTQELPHIASTPASVAQLVLQTPCAQTVPAGHTIPQPPQLFGSLCVSAHEPLQRMPPFAH
jgi:hypothetical protein